MRIARPIVPESPSGEVRVSSFSALADVFYGAREDSRRAQNAADVAMARNLQRSRGLAQRKG